MQNLSIFAGLVIIITVAILPTPVFGWPWSSKGFSENSVYSEPKTNRGFLNQMVKTLNHLRHTVTGSFTEMENALSRSSSSKGGGSRGGRGGGKRQRGGGKGRGRGGSMSKVKSQMRMVFNKLVKDVLWFVVKSFFSMSRAAFLERMMVLINEILDEIQDLLIFSIDEIERIIEVEAREEVAQVQEIYQIVVTSLTNVILALDPLLDLIQQFLDINMDGGSGDGGGGGGYGGGGAGGGGGRGGYGNRSGNGNWK